MSVPKSERTESIFEPVYRAGILYNAVVAMCIKMPKRYTYLILKDTVELSGEVLDYAKMANSIFPTNQHEVQIRIDYWIKARATLQALSGRIDRFHDVLESLSYVEQASGRRKGVTKNEIKAICDLIDTEQKLLTKTIKNERSRYSKLV